MMRSAGWRPASAAGSASRAQRSSEHPRLRLRPPPPLPGGNCQARKACYLETFLEEFAGDKAGDNAFLFSGNLAGYCWHNTRDLALELRGVTGRGQNPLKYTFWHLTNRFSLVRP